MRRIAVIFLLLASACAQKRMVIVDQDALGPAGTNQNSLIALLQSPQVEVLGITVVTGDGWRDENVQHTLRMLELIGRTDVPVVRGAVFPLVRTQDETKLALQQFGKVGWVGAWGGAPDGRNQQMHGPYEVPPLAEGAPHTKPLEEDAAHFLIRQIRAHSHQVTIVALGPLTDIALALRIDPELAQLTQGITIMGGALNPIGDDPEFVTSPRHEFNFWFDPEAARVVLRAHWPRIDLTTLDATTKTTFTEPMLAEIAKSKSAAAQYIARYTKDRTPMWDELAVCSLLDPSIIAKTRDVYMDVDVSHGPSYGDTLTWAKEMKPELDLQLVHAQVEADAAKFSRMFVDLMTTSPPHSSAH